MWSAQDQKRNYVLVNTTWAIKVTKKKKANYILVNTAWAIKVTTGKKKMHKPLKSFLITAPIEATISKYTTVPCERAFLE